MAGGFSSMIGIGAIMMVVAILAVNVKTSSSELDPDFCFDVVADYVYGCTNFFSGSEAKPDDECCNWFRTNSNVSAEFLVSVCQCFTQEYGCTYHPNLNLNISKQCNFSFPVTLPAINDDNCTLLGSLQ